MVGQIPLSNALAEASPESLSALMSHDPEGEKFKAALPRIVEALRGMREKFALAEAQPKERPKAALKAPLVMVAQTSLDF